MGRPPRTRPIPGMEGFLIDPSSGRIRDSNRNYKTHRQLAGHPFVRHHGQTLYVDELVYKSVHGKSPATVKDERTGISYLTTLAHRDRDPGNCSISNIVLVEVRAASRTMDSLIRKEPDGTAWGAGDYSPGCHGFTYRRKA